MHKHAQLILHDDSDFTFSSCRRRVLWCVFAEAYMAEARELALSVRAFSPIQCISFQSISKRIHEDKQAYERQKKQQKSCLQKHFPWILPHPARNGVRP
jgi:hypothetical protein